MKNKFKIIIPTAIIGLTALIVSCNQLYTSWQEDNNKRIHEEISDSLSKQITETELPSKISLDDDDFLVNYSIDEDLTNYIKKQIKKNSPDYISVVVIDNETGAIVSAIDHTRALKNFNRKLAFSSTHPAASIFKVVSAADLIENTSLDKNSVVPVNGRGTTLYRYQLKDKHTKWTRYLDLKKAFAISNNAVFGKASLQNSNAKSIVEMGSSFGFNQDIMSDIHLPKSTLYPPESDFQQAEVASGFNKKTSMSPLHGAVIASIVSNNGTFKEPYLIESLIALDGSDDQEEIPLERKSKRVIEEQTALELQSMMEMTVSRGTAKSAFRRLNRSLKEDYSIGGKTGSITGGLPYGKRDWFIAYAKPKDQTSNSGISLCVMVVNLEKWRIKSSSLARKIIEYYHKRSKQHITKGF